MKKFITLVILAAVFGLTSQAHATVGGPIYISNFKYNPADTSIYFLEQDQSGRGCPPLLSKFSLSTEKVSSVITCDQAEKLSDDDLQGEILGITVGFKDLAQIDLSKNGIRLDVTYDHEEQLPGDNFIIRRHFNVKAYQDNVPIDEFQIAGCDLNQPFLFGGYAIPGLTKKIALLLSTKGDCWEGGYTYEGLHILNAAVKDRNPVTTSPKTAQPLASSDATLTIYSKDSVPVASPTPSATDGSSITPPPPSGIRNDAAPITAVVIAVVCLLLGVAVGFFLKKKSPHS